MTDFPLVISMTQGYLVCSSNEHVKAINANLDQNLKSAPDVHPPAYRKTVVHPAPSSFTVRALPPTKQGEFYARILSACYSLS